MRIIVTIWKQRYAYVINLNLIARFFLLLQNIIAMIQILKNKYSARPGALLAFTIFLLAPALFINLGLMPFILDEATRANVALEMLYSGNYFVPTINGEFYYNKPPLYNWILLLFVSVTGNKTEFVFRLPTVVFLLVFAFTIYRTQREQGGKVVALFSALAFISCGRILFYDSFRGLIDIGFSWIIYLVFWSVYKYGKRKEYLNLFLIAYMLTTVGFLMKGLPSLVFLGISLLAWFIYQRDFKKLFSWEHAAGLAFLALIIGSYLLVYSRYNSLDTYFTTLWTESSKRTLIDNSFWNSFRHLFIFPLDLVLHFLPWTALLLVFIWKRARHAISRNSFARFALLMAGSNIVVYWLSPAIYPRYLFMFLPLLFYISFLGFFEMLEVKRFRRTAQIVLIILTSIAALVSLIIPYFVERPDLTFFIKYLAVFIPVVFILINLFRPGQLKLLNFVAILLVLRIGFNLFIFEDRIEHGSELYEKNGALAAAELSIGKPLYLYDDTRLHHASTYYITRTRGQILSTAEGKPVSDHLYLIETDKLDQFPPHKEIFRFQTRIEGLKISLIRPLP